MDAYDELLNKANNYVANYNPDEQVNYNDQRLLDVKSEQAQQEANINKTYDNMINSSNQFYQDQINASKEYAQKQSEIQQQNTDFAIEKINQEKEQAGKDYTKEQKGAYTDYQKQINQYGVNAEQMAASGLRNSGYSESSMVGMYNTYQNRVATARDGYNRAIQNYNNSIKEAQLANNSALAQIAFNALQQQLELSLQGFQYKNSLVEAKINQINANNTRYDNKYQNILAQINKELDKKQNQYNIYSDFINQDKQWKESNARKDAELAEQRRQFELELEEKKRQWNADFDLQMRKIDLQAQEIAEQRAARQAAQLQVNNSNSTKVDNTPSAQNLFKNMKIVQGPNVKYPIKDGYSGKTFKSVDEMLNYYGYAAVE